MSSAPTLDTVLGTPASRVDGRLKVTGAAQYAAEIPIPGVRFALLRGSSIAHGRIKSIDSSKAEAMPGVVGVLTHKNMPRLGTDIQTFPLGTAGTRRLPMQDDQIFYEGEYVACVVGESIEAAGRALASIVIEYEEEKPVIFDDCLRDGIPPIELGDLPKDASAGVRLDFAQPVAVTEEHAWTEALAPEALPDALAKQLNGSRGDPDAGIADADVIIRSEYKTSAVYQSPIEIGATIAVWQDDHLTVYDSTQHIMGVRNALARVLQIERDRVRVITHFVGGAFGGKCFTWPHTMLAAVAAREFKVPTKLMLNREQMFHGMGYRAPMLQKLELGAKQDGRLTVVLHEAVSQTSMTDVDIPPAVETTKALYTCENVRTRQAIYRCHVATPCRMRAPGEALGLFALESGMDELAHKLGMDPIELRLRNYAEVHPETGKPWSTKGLRECYRKGAEHFGWYRRNPAVASMRDGEFLIGMGMSSAIYPTMMSPVQARVKLFADGHAVGQCATQEMGQGGLTVYSQIVAQELGLALSQVYFQAGDTNLPPAPVSGGSRGAVSVGSAVQAAAANLRSKLINLAVQDSSSPLFGCPVQDVIADASRLQSRSDADRHENYVDLLRRQSLDVLEANGAYFPWTATQKDMDVTAAGTTRTFGPNGPDKHTYTYGANFVEVRVHAYTGKVWVTRATGVFAAGRILNPKLAASQALGGMVFGIGLALMEGSTIDPNSGRLVTSSLGDYHIPVNADIENIQTHFIDEYDLYISPLGSKGVGEIGTTGSAAAVTNAIFHATGCRVRQLPATPDQLLTADLPLRIDESNKARKGMR